MIKLTDAERNLKIAKLAYPKADGIRMANITFASNENDVFLSDVHLHYDKGSHFIFNPLDNLNDLMPLVFEHRISLISNWIDGNWCAANTTKSIWKSHENPQQALIECLLKVLESKDD